MKVDVAKALADKNPRLYPWLPTWVLNALARLVHQDEINEFLAINGRLQNVDFARAVLRHLNITTRIIGSEHIPPEHSFVLVSNHPLGGPDGLALFDMLGGYRDKFASMSNDIIMQIEPLQDLFVPINKHGTQSRAYLQILKSRINQGYGILIFPAGLVSRRSNGIIRDLPWKKTAISIARRAKVPVIPVHISGQLSNRFYQIAAWRKRLGIPWNIEMFLLVDELFKLRNTTITLTVGEAIPWENLDASRSDLEWTEWVYERVYALEQNPAKPIFEPKPKFENAPPN